MREFVWNMVVEIPVFLVGTYLCFRAMAYITGESVAPAKQETPPAAAQRVTRG